MTQPKAKFPNPPAFASRATAIPAQGIFTKHETRDTNHGFLSIHGLGRQAHRLQGGRYEARENEWKGVFLNPETGITTYTESGFGSRFGIPHYSSVFVGKIRISPSVNQAPPRPLRQPGHRPHPSRRGATAAPPPGFWVARHETRNTAFLGARRKPARIPRFSRNTKHETRITAFFRFTAFLKPGSASWRLHLTARISHHERRRSP